jgi:hypothetical protein
MISRYRKGNFVLLTSNPVLSEYDEGSSAEAPAFESTALPVGRHRTSCVSFRPSFASPTPTWNSLGRAAAIRADCDRTAAVLAVTFCVQKTLERKNGDSFV